MFAMIYNAAEFLCHVDGLDMDQAAKLDLIHVVASVMESFVDRAWGHAPEQILLGIDRETSGAGVGQTLDSNRTITSTFDDASFGALARKSPP